MIRDVTTALRRAAKARGTWTPEDAGRAAEAVAGFEPDRLVEWDYDAGEKWARVLDGQGVVALISAEAPVMVLRGSEGDPSTPLDSRLGILWVDALDGPELRTDLPALLAAFPALEETWGEDSDLNPDCFTAEELWLATV